MSEEPVLTGTFICPKCGFEFQVRGKRRMLFCLMCGDNLYAVYPRAKVELYSEIAAPRTAVGYLCHRCLNEILNEARKRREARTGRGG